MPDSVMLKYHDVIDAACRRAGFEPGSKFLAVLSLAVRSDAGLPPAELAIMAEEFRLGMAEFAAGASHG
ncbi:MAG: hypothetical protein EOS73_32080 [Mesorhizobium sp.]|nr:MAG: hypothetical protein EOS73_32080 [Mesorhizobium sp.]